MNITRGKRPRAVKVVVYGPEGVGKSSFASHFPEPLYIDTEGSTDQLDVARVDIPTSYTMIKNQVDYIIANPNTCKTLIIDTYDWAEQLLVNDICATNSVKGIEDFGFGKGYVYLREETARFLHKLDDVIQIGVNVVLLAHSQVKKFDQPDELGSYDRWELKLGKSTGSSTAALVKEWADMILFANFKTHVTQMDKEGKKFKAQGHKRVMYTSHSACFDAKNRFGLAEELPFDFKEIEHIFKSQEVPKPKEAQKVKVETEVKAEKVEEPIFKDTEIQSVAASDKEIPFADDDDIPEALFDLMMINNVSELEIRQAVAERKYYTIDTPISKYGNEFIDGVLVGAWDAVFNMIKQNRKELPF